jgi:acetyl esterase/lipase
MEADQETTKSVSVLLVAYTLVPEAHYPAQLNQAATVLSYLLSDKKRDPASVIIGGDSAGGNLAISLLSHILHPRPGTPRISLTAPLRGVMLYSPWISFSTKHDSYLRNAGKDTLVDSMLRAWGSMYLGLSKDGEISNEEVETDSYNEPLRNGSGWWQGMHEVASEVFIWMGRDEVFIDGLRDFTKVFIQGWKAGGGSSTDVKPYEAIGQPHIGPIMDVLMEDKNKSRSQLHIEEWFRRLLDKNLSTKM